MSEHITLATCNDDARLGAWPRQTDATSSSHPDAILADGSLSADDKRRLLASLASDRRAVADRPALRRGDDGEICHIDDILHALRLLDCSETSVGGDRDRSRRARPSWRFSFNKRSKRPGPDDDDDPPPCPAGAHPVGPAPVDGMAGALAAA